MLGLFIDLSCASVWANLWCDDEEIFVFRYKRWVLQLAETVEGNKYDTLFHLFKDTILNIALRNPNFLSTCLVETNVACLICVVSWNSLGTYLELINVFKIFLI